MTVFLQSQNGFRGSNFGGTIILGVTDPMKGGLLPQSMLRHIKCPVRMNCSSKWDECHTFKWRTVECPMFYFLGGHKEPIFHWESRIYLFWKMSGFPPIFINIAIQDRKIWFSDSAWFFKQTEVSKYCLRKKIDEVQLSKVAKVEKSAAYNYFPTYR